MVSFFLLKRAEGRICVEATVVELGNRLVVDGLGVLGWNGTLFRK